MSWSIYSNACRGSIRKPRTFCAGQEGATPYVNGAACVLAEEEGFEPPNEFPR